MHIAITNNLAYQRYSLESLRRALADKRRRFKHGDFGSATFLENTIIRLAENITAARRDLARMLDGTPVLEYAEKLDAAAAGMIRTLAAELQQREEECGKEHETLKAYAAGKLRPAAFPDNRIIERRGATIQ